jgi:hypothetical protein
MPTIAQCQKRARELTALAECDPQHKAQYSADAAAWLRLASRMLETALRASPAPCREHNVVRLAR